MENVKRVRQSTGGKYYVPPEIKSLRPQPQDMTTVKKIAGQYYVYSLKYVAVPDKPGKTKKTTDTIIGKIVNDKYIPNNVPRIINTVPDILDFGCYLLALSCSGHVLDRLNKYFQAEDALLIYLMGIIYFVNKYTPARDVAEIFSQSVLSIKYKNINTSENSISSFLCALGRHRLPGRQFEQSLIDDGSGTYAIDGHVILCCSQYNELADYGHKYPKYGNMQENFMVVFDVEQNRAMTCCAFDGSIPDKVEVKEIFDHHHFKTGSWLLIDSGFYSDNNFGLFRRDGCSFIIPVPGMTTISKIVLEKSRENDIYKGSFLFSRNDKNGNEVQTPVLYWETKVFDIEEIAYEKKKTAIEEFNAKAAVDAKEGEKPKKRYAGKLKHSEYCDDRIIICKDIQMHDKLATEYLSNIGTDTKHTMDEYKELEPLFGVILLRTNNPSVTPEMCYKKYKKRWRIETFYNHVRNGIDLNHFHESNYYVQQGISFLFVIEDCIYSEVLRKIEESQLPFLHNMSVNECRLRASRLKLSMGIDNQWHRNVIKTNLVDLFEEFGANIDDEIKLLNTKK